MLVNKQGFARYYNTDSKTRNEYYERAYKHLIIERAPFYWNWSAAFGGFIWFAYRRMYRFSLMLLLIPTLVFEGLRYLFNSSNMSLGTLLLCQILSFIVPGLIGTKLYFQWIENQIKQQSQPYEQATDSSTLSIILVLAFAQVSGITSLGFLLISLTLVVEIILQRDFSKKIS